MVVLWTLRVDWTGVLLTMTSMLLSKFKYHLFITLLIVSTVQPLFPETDTCRIENGWQLNERAVYDVTKYRKQTGAPDYAIYSNVDILVQRMEDDYIFRWKENITGIKPSKSIDIVTKTLAGITEKSRLLYRVDTDGILDEVINVDEVFDNYQNTITDLILKLEKKHSRLASSVGGQLNLLFGNPKKSLTIATRDVSMFHGIYGFELEDGETQKFEREMLTPLYREPFVMNVTVRAERENAGITIFHRKETLNFEESSSQIEDMLVGMTLNMGKKIEDTPSPESVSIIDDCSYKILPGKRWPEEIHCSRNLRVANQVKIENVTYILKNTYL